MQGQAWTCARRHYLAMHAAKPVFAGFQASLSPQECRNFYLRLRYASGLGDVTRKALIFLW